MEWKSSARAEDDDENDDVVLSYLSFCVVIAIVNEGNVDDVDDDADSDAFTAQ